MISARTVLCSSVTRQAVVAIEPVEQILVHLLQSVSVSLTAELVVFLLQGEFRLFISLVYAQFLFGVVASRLDFGLVDFIKADMTREELILDCCYCNGEEEAPDTILSEKHMQ